MRRHRTRPVAFCKTRRVHTTASSGKPAGWTGGNPVQGFVPAQGLNKRFLVTIPSRCTVPEWKRSEDHVVRLGSMCTIMPGMLRSACTSVTVSTLQNAACLLHTLWLRPSVVTTDSIHIRRCEAATIVDVGSPRRGRRITVACYTSKDIVQETQKFPFAKRLETRYVQHGLLLRR